MIITKPQFILDDAGKEHIRFVQEERDDLLLECIYALTCDCGARVVWVHRLPYRCRDCGEYWFMPEQINATQARLEAL